MKAKNLTLLPRKPRVVAAVPASKGVADVESELSSVDTLPLRGLPPQLLRKSSPEIKSSIADLSAQGASSKKIRDIIAVEIEVSRVQYRYATWLLNRETEQLAQGKGSRSRLRTLMQVAEHHYQHFQKAIDALIRVGKSDTKFRITAHNVGIAMDRS